MTTNFKHQLGTSVACAVTGFTGIVTGQLVYLNGCIQYLVKPPVDKDGKHVEGQWIDEPQLTHVSMGQRALAYDSSESTLAGTRQHTGGYHAASPADAGSLRT